MPTDETIIALIREHGPISQRWLANRVRCSWLTANAVLRALEAKGLLIRWRAYKDYELFGEAT